MKWLGSNKIADCKVISYSAIKSSCKNSPVLFALTHTHTQLLGELTSFFRIRSVRSLVPSSSSSSIDFCKNLINLMKIFYAIFKCSLVEVWLLMLLICMNAYAYTFLFNLPVTGKWGVRDLSYLQPSFYFSLYH